MNTVISMYVPFCSSLITVRKLWATEKFISTYFRIGSSSKQKDWGIDFLNLQMTSFVTGLKYCDAEKYLPRILLLPQRKDILYGLWHKCVDIDAAMLDWFKVRSQRNDGAEHGRFLGQDAQNGCSNNKMLREKTRESVKRTENQIWSEI